MKQFGCLYLTNNEVPAGACFFKNNEEDLSFLKSFHGLEIDVDKSSVKVIKKNLTAEEKRMKFYVSFMETEEEARAFQKQYFAQGIPDKF